MSTIVDRYDPVQYSYLGSSYGAMKRAPDGDYVTIEDYEKASGQRDELLDALKAVMAEYEGLVTAIPSLKNSEARKSAIAIIAKAEGRES